MRLLPLIWTTLWMTWLLFVLLILTFPLNRFNGHPHWDSITWIPFSEFSLPKGSLFETTANVLIFLPFGYLTVRAWRSRTNHPIFMAGLLSFLCSAAVEFFQLFCDDRSPGTTDLITNVTGGTMGGYLAILLSWSERRLSVDEVEQSVEAT